MSDNTAAHSLLFPHQSEEQIANYCNLSTQSGLDGLGPSRDDGASNGLYGLNGNAIEPPYKPVSFDPMDPRDPPAPNEIREPHYGPWRGLFKSSEAARQHRRRERLPPKVAHDVERVKQRGREYWTRSIYEAIINITDLSDSVGSIHRRRFQEEMSGGNAWDEDDLEATAHDIFDAAIKVYERGWDRPSIYHKEFKRGKRFDISENYRSLEVRLARIVRCLRYNKAVVDDCIRGDLLLDLFVDNPESRMATKDSNNHGNIDRQGRIDAGNEALGKVPTRGGKRKATADTEDTAAKKQKLPAPGVDTTGNNNENNNSAGAGASLVNNNIYSATNAVHNNSATFISPYSIPPPPPPPRASGVNNPAPFISPYSIPPPPPPPRASGVNNPATFISPYSIPPPQPPRASGVNSIAPRSNIVNSIAPRPNIVNSIAPRPNIVNNIAPPANVVNNDTAIANTANTETSIANNASASLSSDNDSNTITASDNSANENTSSASIANNATAINDNTSVVEAITAPVENEAEVNNVSGVYDTVESVEADDQVDNVPGVDDIVENVETDDQVNNVPDVDDIIENVETDDQVNNVPGVDDTVQSVEADDQVNNVPGVDDIVENVETDDQVNNNTVVEQVAGIEESASPVDLNFEGNISGFVDLPELELARPEFANDIEDFAPWERTTVDNLRDY